MAVTSCEKCGIKISNDDNFCPNCGAPAKESQGEDASGFNAAGCNPAVHAANGCNPRCGCLSIILFLAGILLLSNGLHYLGIIDLNECYTADDCDYGHVCETQGEGYNECYHMNDYP